MSEEIDLRAAEADVSIIESSSIGMLAVDLTGKILRANTAASEILGVPLDELIGSNGIDRLQPRERAMAEQKLDLVRSGDYRPTRDLYSFTDPSGHERWIEVESTLLHATDGKPSHGISMLRDVTDELTVAEELASSSSSLHHLVHNAPVALLSVDTNGLVQSWNPAAEQMFGWRANEILGKRVPILPDAEDRDLESTLGRLANGETITGYQIEARHKDGHAVHIVTSGAARRNAQGEVDTIVAYAIDVSDRVAAEQQLLSRDRRFRRMIDNLREMVAIVDPTGKVLASSVFAGSDSLSDGGAATTHLDLDDILPHLHPDDRVRAAQLLAEVSADQGVEHTATLRLADPFRGWAYIQATVVNLSDDPDVGGIVLTAHDVSGHKRNEALLADQASILELIARNALLYEVLDAIVAMVGEHSTGSTSAVLLVEGDDIEVGAGDLTDELADAFAEPGAAQRFGVVRGALESREAIVVTDLANDPLCADSRDLLDACGMRAGWAVPIMRSDDSEPLGVLATWFDAARAPSGHERRVAAAAVHLADIAIERSRAQHDLARSANFDQLTGLPNRRQLQAHMEAALERAAERSTNVAVMFLDLDRFKLVNDNFGHTVGDHLMVLFAARLRSLLRPGDVVGRFEGDEFVVVLEDVVDELDVRSITNRFEFALSEPFAIEGGEVVLTASIGIAISTGEESAHDLLQNADVALVRAKERGRDTIEMFDDELRTRARERLEVERDLRLAIERGELAVFYQPKIDLRSGTIFGAEALIRWFHPVHGLVGPASFIPVAEETGLITRIGRWVLDESLHQARTWLDRGNGGLPMTLSVNLSARQLRAPDLVGEVERSLVRHGWDPKHLILELTESILIDDTDGTIRRLQELKDLGVRLAIDDFGTGYSSLSYLDQLPVDVVKIDRAFVSRVQADGTGASIVTAVLHMAAALDLIVLGEGVEEQHQLDGLRHLGCHWAQGYHFARPMPAKEMTDLLDNSPTW